MAPVFLVHVQYTTFLCYFTTRKFAQTMTTLTAALRKWVDTAICLFSPCSGIFSYSLPEVIATGGAPLPWISVSRDGVRAEKVAGLGPNLIFRRMSHWPQGTMGYYSALLSRKAPSSHPTAATCRSFSWCVITADSAYRLRQNIYSHQWVYLSGSGVCLYPPCVYSAQSLTSS